MASSNKEFEEQLMDAVTKLSDPPSSVDEILATLDKAEFYLSRVEQSPNKSIEEAIAPCAKALVADKLFRHEDTDVMVAVASCISEITRITAPEAPYTDEQMKEVFRLIVSSFEHMDDNSSRSFAKRISILETLAKVRSCVVMLDLECDALIHQMFQHFLKTIRDFHSEKVFSSMETIMTLVIEESEDVSLELLSQILDTLKRDNEVVLPIARRLGEKVVQNCAAKLKAYLGQTLQSLGTSVDDYSEVVSMCMIHEDDSAENRIDAAHVGEPEVETEVASPKSEVSNGEKPATESETLEEAVSEKQPEVAPPRPRLKITGLLSKDKPGVSDLEKESKTPGKSKKSSRKRGRKWSSAKRMPNPAAVTTVDGEKEQGTSLDNGEDPTGVLPISPQENQLARADLPSTDGKEAVTADLQKTAIASIDFSDLSKGDELQEKEEPLKETKEQIDSVQKENYELEKKSGGGASNEDRTPIKVKISRKRTQSTDNAKTDPEKPSTEKVKASSHEDISLESLRSKDKDEPAKAEMVLENDIAVSAEKVADQGAVLTSKVSKKRRREEDQPVKTAKDKGVHKQTPAKEVASGSKEYGEELIGSKVKVWWPKDKKYYEGIVNSFDSKKKKHTILYNDGDVENLILRKERWEIIQEFSGSKKEMPTEEARESSPEIPLKKLLEMQSKKLSSKKGKVSSKKSEVKHKPQEGHKTSESLEAESGGKAKDSNTPNIGSKLVGLARLMTSKSKDNSDNGKEVVVKPNLKKDRSTASKARTLRTGSKTKVRAGAADKLKSTSSKPKLKEGKDVLRDSEEMPSGKQKSSLLKPKSEEIKAVEDSVGQPSNKAKAGLLKVKGKEKKEVSTGSGEELTSKVKSSSTANPKANLKLKAKDSKEMVVVSGEDSSEKVKSSKLKKKRKLKERDNVDMETEENPSGKLKSATSKKQKPKLKESEDLVKNPDEVGMELSSLKLNVSKVEDASGEESSAKVDTNISKPEENVEVKPDSGEETSDKLNTESNPTPKPEENREAEPEPRDEPSEQKDDSSMPKEKEVAEEVDSEETEDDTATEKKPLVKLPSASRRKTGKKRLREA